MDELIHIMAVEDEVDIREIIQVVLVDFGGFQLTLFSGGAEALNSDITPQLILLDVMMPEMDGPTLFGKLRERAATANTPIIFMTAKVQTHEVEKLKSLGALGVIAKPFDPLRLPEQIRALWRQGLANKTA